MTSQETKILWQWNKIKGEEQSLWTEENKNPTSSLERKVRCALQKIKQKLPTDVYAKLYPTGSSPGKFYGTAKVHKLAINDTIEELPLPLL